MMGNGPVREVSREHLDTAARQIVTNGYFLLHGITKGPCGALGVGVGLGLGLGGCGGVTAVLKRPKDKELINQLIDRDMIIYERRTNM